MYIGHGSPLQLYPDNTRDDLVPDPGSGKVTFNLSQEVPGGYEGNVLVFRRKFLYDDIAFGTADLEFTSVANTVSTSDGELADLLSRIQVGDTVFISGAVETENNGNLLVTAVNFVPGTSIEFTVQKVLADETGGSIDIKGGFDGPWEVLEPEVDYTIGGVFPFYNKQITLSEILQEEDVCYVVHKSTATYSLVPSPNSVGPEQLSLNIRNFRCDRFTGDAVEDEFTLSTEPINSRAIQVTVDGVLSDGDDVSQSFVGDWELDGSIVRFHSPPANGVAIRVLHLGFSTVSRRAALSDGQIGVVPPASVTSLELANNSVITAKLDDLAVTTAKINNNSVTGPKILLANEQPLRATLFGGGDTGLIRLNSDDETVISAPTGGAIQLEIDGNNHYHLTETLLEPTNDATIDLGSSSKKFRDAYLSGDLNVDGLVDGVDIAALDTEAFANTTAVADIYATLVPLGTILMTALPSAPTRFMLCQGQAISRVTYAALFTAIGTTYGPGDGSTTFNLPDLRQRFPLGKTDAVAQPATNLAATGGTITPTVNFAHTHNVSATGALVGHVHSGATQTVNINHIHYFGHNHTSNHTHTTPLHRHSNLHIVGTGAHDHQININTETLQFAASAIAGATTPRGIIRTVGPTYSANNGLPIFTQGFAGAHDHLTSVGSYVGSISGGSVDADLGPMTTSTPSTGSIAGLPAVGPAVTAQAQSVYGNDLGVPQAFPKTSDVNITPNVSPIKFVEGFTQTSQTSNVDASAPTQAVTGNTTSQSVSSASTQNPPYIVVNYMIKVEA